MLFIYQNFVTNAKIEENALTQVAVPNNGKCAPEYSSVAAATTYSGFSLWAPLRRTSNSESGDRGAAAEGECREYPACSSRARA